MTLKIYGTPASRTVRTLWMADELGLEYENIPVHYQGEAQQPEFLAVNPNGRIPTIDDDGLIIWESMAINLYLARKHGGELAPRDLAEEAQAVQWSFWAITECEKALLDALVLSLGLFGVEKNQAKAQACVAQLERPFGVLDSQLQDRDWLLGDRFTVADLNVAAILVWIRMAQLDIAAWPRLQSWLQRCLSRPAAAKHFGG